MRRSWTRTATNALILRSGRRAALRRIVAALGALVAAAGCSVPVRQPQAPAQPTIADRVAQYGPAARARLAPYFAAAGIAYPPERFVLLGFKHERELHLLASGSGRPLAFIRSYPIQGASGGLGPKLREGDRQVPEGIYAIEYLNPNSVAHLSLALSYPNVYDRDRAAEDGRDALGGDIMIHGGSASIGCLAMGDEAAEELFVLAADSGWEDAVVVLSPVDFRRSVLPADYRAPAAWVEYLYFWLRTTLETFPLEPGRVNLDAPSPPGRGGAQLTRLPVASPRPAAGGRGVGGMPRRSAKAPGRGHVATSVRNGIGGCT